MDTTLWWRWVRAWFMVTTVWMLFTPASTDDIGAGQETTTPSHPDDTWLDVTILMARPRHAYGYGAAGSRGG